jgi:mono/diheme cytochrome c family protein
MRVRAWPHPTFVSRNLTSDSETGIGKFSPEQIATTIRNGRRPDRLLDPWGMPWFVLHAFAPEDAMAIGTYLTTMPPVQNRIPEPLRFGFIETLVGKLTAPLPAAIPYFLEYGDGNWGESGLSKGIARDSPQRVLENAQLLVLGLAIVLFILAGPREKRFPRGARGWAKALGFALGLVLVALIARVIVDLPQIIPADQLSQGVLGAVPVPDPKKHVAPEQMALARRGEYLFKVSSCAFCHGPDGSGGTKISWRPFGTLFARNISSDPEAGIGAWTDQEVARAIRSGLSRDGRQLHWQGMIWDQLSNLDEEDLRALLVYLRGLPPVRKSVPLPRSPSADDCELYRFFLRGKLGEPGCR